MDCWARNSRKKGHRSEVSGCKRLFYFLCTNRSFHIVKFAILSARWVHTTALISSRVKVVTDVIMCSKYIIDHEPFSCPCIEISISALMTNALLRGDSMLMTFKFFCVRLLENVSFTCSRIFSFVAKSLFRNSGNLNTSYRACLAGLTLSTFF